MSTSTSGRPTGQTPADGSGPGPRGLPAVRRAYRDTETGVIGGVAAGLAHHLGLPVLGVRAFFVLAAVPGFFFGVFLYAALWLVLPAAPPLERSTPGAEAHARSGRRPGRTGRLADVGPVVALLALGAGLVLTLEAVLGTGPVLWAILLGVVGVALLWRQADQAQRDRWLDTTARVDPAKLVFGRGGWEAYARLAAGLVLVVAAGMVVWLDNGAMLADGWGILVAIGLLAIGVLLVVGPWVLRLASDLSTEREERIRSQERADVAAHLHDSVLQTLALIQRNASDPTTVARLARAQERDLRTWLYDAPADPQETFAAALRAAAAEVEDAHGITVDVVVVGDGPLDATSTPVLAAAREAMTNAGKHAGTGRVDVYAEVVADALEVFVRDRGAGFDPGAVPLDRHGVRGSIVERMARHGGRATVRSAPGQGTEVRLHMPREGTDG